MSAESVARAHLAGRRQLADAVSHLARDLWRRMDPADLDASWARIAPQLLVGLTGAQLAAARTADGYVGETLAEQGADAAAEFATNPGALAGVASDGRDLPGLLLNAVTTVKASIGAGATVEQSMLGGLANLTMLMQTQVADAGRGGDSVALVANRIAHGYVRMVSGGACGRCVVLAGRFYHWNAGFLRHPHCHCVHVPAAEDHVGDIRTHPRAFFDSLSSAEQDKQFTRAGAQAIRDGADIGQIVNSRRGAFGLSTASGRITDAEARLLRGGRGRLRTQSVFGQDLFVTTEGTTTRGVAGRQLGARETGQHLAGNRYRTARAPRLMPESIYKIAGDDRDEALRLLERNGYIRRTAPRTAPRPIAVSTRSPVPATAVASPAPLERGIASGVRESKPLSGGAVGDVQLVTFNDGSQAVRKVAGKSFANNTPVDLTDKEYLSTKVGLALRAPVPEIVRAGDTELFMGYVADARPAFLAFRKYRVAERDAKVAEFIDTREGRLLGLMDLLTANGDRHLYNWLVRKDGSIVGIDHGSAWPTGQITAETVRDWAPAFSSPFARMFNTGLNARGGAKGWFPNKLTQADINWIRGQLEGLRPEFAARGHENWLDYSLARLSQMNDWADGDVDLVRP